MKGKGMTNLDKEGPAMKKWMLKAIALKVGIALLTWVSDRHQRTYPQGGRGGLHE